MIRFALPWGLLGLLSIPILLGIYFLIGRSKTYVVSSLFLWEDPKISPVGGRRFETLRTPLTFFLELLILILISLALARPELHMGAQKLPLVVILDNSYSMLAGDDDSARVRAQKELESLLNGRYDPIHFILAGETPQLIQADVSGDQPQWQTGWSCDQPGADLTEAIAAAREIGGPRANLIVLTDHAPDFEITPGKLRWLAFGKTRDNVAFVNASRGQTRDRDKVLLEVLAFSRSQVNISLSGINQETQSLSLNPDERRRLTFAVPRSLEVASFSLSGDALPFDNQVHLIRQPLDRIRVQNDLSGPLGIEVTRALTATEQALVVNSRPQIVIDNNASGEAADGAWRLSIRKPGDARPLLGPFVTDTRHPLTEGLALGGIVWSASGTSSTDHTPIILAGNVPLVEQVSDARNTRLLMNFDHERSTLTRAPAWPIFFANLIEWYKSAAPGLERFNIALGDVATLTLENIDDLVILTDPNGKQSKLDAVGRSFALPITDPGLYQIKVGSLSQKLAVNPLNITESDLRNARTGKWGDWRNSSGNERGWRKIGTYCLLLALAVLALHMWVVHRERAEVTP